MTARSPVFLTLALLATALSSARAMTVERVAVGIGFRSWTLEHQTDPSTSERIDQLAYPVNVSLRVHPRVNVVASTRGGLSSLSPEDGPTSRISGLPDLAIEAFWRVLRDRLIVSWGVNLPTGHEALTTEELEVARVLGNPLAGFRVRQIGEGTKLNGSMVYGSTLPGGTPFAVGVGYIGRGAYTLLEGGGEFDPATEVSVSAGVDIGRSFALTMARLDATFRTFGTDEWAGEPVFEEGDQLELQTTVTMEEKPLGGYLMLRGIVKGDDRTILTGDDELPITPGAGLFVRCAVRRALRWRTRAGLAIDWNHYSGSDYPGLNGDLFAIGPTAEFPWSDEVRVGVRLLYHTGSFEEETEDTDVVGISVDASLTWRP